MSAKSILGALAVAVSTGGCLFLAAGPAQAAAKKHVAATSRAAATAAVEPAAKATAKKARPRPAAAPADDDPDVVTYGRRDDVVRWADEVAERRGLPAGWVEETLARARYQPSVARFIMPPPVGTAKNWAAYRARFVEPTRIRAGAAFWRRNQRWLTQAEATYGVPPEIIVGIIGVETLYGRHMGNYRVLDALATLAFDFPPGRKDRSEFFREELEQFLLLCQAQGLDPLALRGSYAGAFGMPQFMPSSFNKHAVDFDGDGRIDLLTDGADVIGSVANYLAAFGWQRGVPTRYEVAPPSELRDRAVLLAPDIDPQFTPEEFAAHGALLSDAGMASAGPLALVEVQNGEDAPPSYVAGTRNFYVVTRYNWSSYYALAVIELGEAVARERELIDRTSSR